MGNKNEIYNIYYNEYDNNNVFYNLNLIGNKKDNYLITTNNDNVNTRLKINDLMNYWEISNSNNQIVLVNELTKALKNSLKKEYFSSKNERIKISDKNIKVGWQISL